MSFQAMAWAVGLRLPTRDKFVLIMLANYASNDRGDCYPSINRLADDTSMTRNTVITAIQALEALGALAVLRRTADGVNLPNVYRLNLAWVGSATGALPGGSATDAPVVQGLVGGSAGVAPEPVIEPITKKKVEKASPAAPAAVVTFDPDQAVFVGLTSDHFGRWARAFPAINVEAQVEHAAVWLHANPANRKSNNLRFITNWLSKAQDRAPRVGPSYGANQHGSRATPSDRRQDFGAAIDRLNQRPTGGDYIDMPA